MEYQEKKTIVLITSGILLILAYCISAYLSYQQLGQEVLGDLGFWAKRMLIFIAIGIVGIIIIQIIFHILLAISSEIAKEVRKHKPLKVGSNSKAEDDKEEVDDYDMPGFEDERDKLIKLKGNSIAYTCVGAGFMMGLVSLLIKMEPAIMLNIFYLSFMISTVIGSFVELHYYKRGI